MLVRATYVGVTVFTLFMCAPAQADSATPHCRYVNLVTLPAEMAGNRVVVQGSINGKASPMLIDTGAQRTTLASQGVDYFGLSLLHSQVSQSGIGGEAVTYQAVADDMALGKFHTWPHKRLMVEMNSLLAYKVIVGADILFNSDVEFNPADHYIKFFKPADCDKTSLAYWSDGAIDVASADISSTDIRQVVTVEINGQKLRALIDSGSQYSLVNTAFAARLGITPGSPNVKKIGTAMGSGTHQIDTWISKFDSFSIGEETIKNPSFLMTDLWGAMLSDNNNIAMSAFTHDQPDMLLGADFLRTHRVLMALSQHRLYFSYMGGDVFPDLTQAPGKVSGNPAIK